jgi:Cu-Zn family superoxide dismutase
MGRFASFAFVGLVLLTNGALAQDLVLSKISDGSSIGTIALVDDANGILISPKLHGLPSGSSQLGLHLHDAGDCMPGMPGHSGHHHDGNQAADAHAKHQSSLGEIEVDKKGQARKTSSAQGMSLKDVKGMALIIDGPDDMPFACAVIR